MTPVIPVNCILGMFWNRWGVASTEAGAEALPTAGPGRWTLGPCLRARWLEGQESLLPGPSWTPTLAGRTGWGTEPALADLTDQSSAGTAPHHPAVWGTKPHGALAAAEQAPCLTR